MILNFARLLLPAVLLLASLVAQPGTYTGNGDKSFTLQDQTASALCNTQSDDDSSDAGDQKATPTPDGWVLPTAVVTLPPDHFPATRRTFAFTVAQARAPPVSHAL